jgi:site-specific DNA recombinase
MRLKQYVALARVSSREQEREGFSLAVQEEGLYGYAAKAGGQIVKFYKIAETASKRDERKTFRDLIAYAKKHAAELDGILFYKVDRAARNLFDYVELERLESEYQVPFISISQPTDNNPSGRMMRRTLANIASFYTEQMAVDISQGINRRVQDGWFPGRAPYGYRNVRRSGRSIVEIEDVPAANVRRIYHLYAYENKTLDGIFRKLSDEGVIYRPGKPHFSRTTIHNILNDRAYIGEIQYRGQWYPGKHKPLVDRGTWDRVRALSGGGGHASHSMTYADDLIKCQHCGYRITGEVKVKKTKAGERSYHYYRCTYYNKPGHPRTRVTEAQLDQQILALFDKMRVEDEGIRDWIRAVLAAKTRDDQQETQAQRAELLRQLTLMSEQKDRLLNLRIAGEIDPDTFAAKQTQLRDREASLKLQLDSIDRGKDENAELAGKVFELSQTLREKWLTADFDVKRKILEIVLLNCTLHDVTLVPTIRKPFDMLVEGLLVPQSGG